jgi:hypothetical protein
MAEVLYGSKSRKYGEAENVSGARGERRVVGRASGKGVVIRVSRWMGGKAGRQPGTGGSDCRNRTRPQRAISWRRRNEGEERDRRTYAGGFGGWFRTAENREARSLWLCREVPLPRGRCERGLWRSRTRHFRIRGCRHHCFPAIISACNRLVSYHSNSRRGAAHSNAQRRFPIN